MPCSIATNPKAGFHESLLRPSQEAEARAELLITGDQLFALGKRRLAEASSGPESNHDPPSAA